MKKFPFDKEVHPSTLSEEIVAALVLSGLTELDARNRDGGICVRSNARPDNPIATRGEVVVSESFADSLIQDVIDAHSGELARRAFLLTRFRVKAKEAFADSGATIDPVSVTERAAALLMMDEINLLRQWIMSFKVELAAATSLANFQSRVAGLPNLPDRTASQIKPAIRNRIDSPDVG